MKHKIEKLFPSKEDRNVVISIMTPLEKSRNGSNSIQVIYMMLCNHRCEMVRRLLLPQITTGPTSASSSSLAEESSGCPRRFPNIVLTNHD